MKNVAFTLADSETAEPTLADIEAAAKAAKSAPKDDPTILALFEALRAEPHVKSVTFNSEKDAKAILTSIAAHAKRADGMHNAAEESIVKYARMDAKQPTRVTFYLAK